jgi:hypothetical protein
VEQSIINAPLQGRPADYRLPVTRRKRAKPDIAELQLTAAKRMKRAYSGQR